LLKENGTAAPCPNVGLSVLDTPPKENPVDGVVLLAPLWNENPVDEGFVPAPEAGAALPKLNEEGWAVDAVGEGLAPPKLNCGWVPPGPNLPNLAGEASSRFFEGVKVLLSGVAGCSGPAGANENRLVGFLASLDGVAAGAVNLKGVDADSAV
jgi:hypothetical protein